MIIEFTKKFLFRTPLHILIPCYVLILIIFFSISGILYKSFFSKTQFNVSNSQILSRGITEREVIISNRTFSVIYDYSTNVVPYSGDTNNIVIKIRSANITVFEIVGTNRIQIDGIMRGVIIKTGNFDKQSDEFYVFKALLETNQP
jgi:hypothetical protein